MLLEALRPPGLFTRPAEPEDRDFQSALFLSARPHLQSLPLPEAALAQLMDQQYDFQQADYQRRFAGASRLIVQERGVPIGALTVHDSGADLHIVDIVITPAVRGQGYGAALLRWVQGSAAVLGCRVTLSVDAADPAAQRLYERLGFASSGIDAVQLGMAWHPPAPWTPSYPSCTPTKR